MIVIVKVTSFYVHMNHIDVSQRLTCHYGGCPLWIILTRSIYNLTISQFDANHIEEEDIQIRCPSHQKFPNST